MPTQVAVLINLLHSVDAAQYEWLLWYVFLMGINNICVHTPQMMRTHACTGWTMMLFLVTWM